MKWILGTLTVLAAFCFAAGWWSKRHEQAADDEAAVAILYLAGIVLASADGLIFIAATIYQVWAR